jgi:death-on-curing protein
VSLRYLTTDDLLLLVTELGAGPVRDVGLLGSAAGRPQTTVFGSDAYPSVPEKAAALLHSITNNHALVDGNKRLAWLAAVVFLDLNGWDVALSDDEAFALVMSASTSDHDVAEIAERLRATPR